MKDDNVFQAWMQNGKLLQCLEELKEIIFQQSVSLLLNKYHRQLVIDNKIIASQADEKNFE